MGKENLWWKFIECDCASEGVMISAENDDPTTYLAFFGNFFDRRLGFKQRARFIWNVLTTGKPYADMVCLSPEKVKELATSLNEVVVNNKLKALN